LCVDPVPNVRFNCVKVVMALAQNGQLGGKAADSLMEDEKESDDQRKQAVASLMPVVLRLVQDSDNDVKYYAQLCLQALQTASEPH